MIYKNILTEEVLDQEEYDLLSDQEQLNYEGMMDGVDVLDSIEMDNIARGWTGL